VQPTDLPTGGAVGLPLAPTSAPDSSVARTDKAVDLADIIRIQAARRVLFFAQVVSPWREIAL
jgi:hypothetical protein